MFHCGCDPANVEEGVPMIYQQASYDSACAAAVDDEAFYYNHVVKHNNQTYQEQRRPTTDYFQHLPINSEMQSALIIPTSPITSQHQRAQQQEPQLPALPSNKSLEVTPVNSIEVTPVSSNRTLVTVTPDKVAAQRFHPPNRIKIKHTVSNVTESTHSMSDDEMSIDESNSQHDNEEVVIVRKPLVSILRQKPEDSPRRIIQSPSRTHTETRVQFAANTNLVNPAQRQHVPRLSLEARYAYAYQAGWLSATQERAFLQAVRNPKASPLKICTTSTMTNSAAFDVREGACLASSPHHADSSCDPERKRFQQRLERRKGQNQYLYRTHNTIGAAFESSPSPYMCKYGAPHPTTTVSSSSSYATKKHCSQSSASYTAAEELLLSQLNYNDNSGFYVFR